MMLALAKRKCGPSLVGASVCGAEARRPPASGTFLACALDGGGGGRVGLVSARTHAVRYSSPVSVAALWADTASWRATAACGRRRARQQTAQSGAAENNRSSACCWCVEEAGECSSGGARPETGPRCWGLRSPARGAMSGAALHHRPPPGKRPRAPPPRRRRRPRAARSQRWSRGRRGPLRRAQPAGGRRCGAARGAGRQDGGGNAPACKLVARRRLSSIT